MAIPTPASRAIARIDGSVSADANTRVALSLPAGFGTDYAGVVDQVGDGVTGFAPGDRVFGGALSRAVADFVVVDSTGGIAANEAHHTPDGVDDRTAATLAIAGRTASAALAVVELGPNDTVLIGGAAGGVGVFVVQMARIAGARVIGTASAASADFLRALGAEPVAYGDGLADRVRALAPRGITAAIDLYGTETAHAARALGVPDTRITTIAAQVDGITPTNGKRPAPLTRRLSRATSSFEKPKTRGRRNASCVAEDDEVQDPLRDGRCSSCTGPRARPCLPSGRMRRSIARGICWISNPFCACMTTSTKGSLRP